MTLKEREFGLTKWITHEVSLIMRYCPFNTLPYLIHTSKVESTRDHGRVCVSTCSYRHDSVFETLWDGFDY